MKGSVFLKALSIVIFIILCMNFSYKYFFFFRFRIYFICSLVHPFFHLQSYLFDFYLSFNH